MRSVKECGDESVSAGRGPGQLPWYRFASGLVAGKTVLDVGCGLGKGMEILRQNAASVNGQDLDPRLAGPEIHIGPVDQIPGKSYDVVTCFDVIEHVQDDQEFVRHLVRIARQGLFLTTPNWTTGRCRWPYHVREYTPQQWLDLFAPFGEATLYKGTSNGASVYPVVHRGAYFLFNSLRTWPPTSFATRCWNRLLPHSWRIQSHNAIWVTLKN
jgi:SAM-dependent methyltransferase